MGLKNKLSKMKNFLFDEEEEKEGKVAKVKEKKQVKKQVEEKNLEEDFEEDFKVDNDVEELYFEDTNVDLKKDDIIKSRVVKNEQEFKFPEFDDDDFMVPKEEPKEEKKVKEQPKIPLYQGSKRKEESKKFKPSPIISPIYGLLDSEGNTIKKDSDTSGIISKNSDEVSFDDVRKKAYGIVDKELSDTIEKLSKKTIEEAEKDMEEEEKALSRTKAKKVVEEKEESKDDDMILPNINFKEIDIDEQISKKEVKKVSDEDDDEEDTKEQDLFKLIDTMYDKEGKDE